MDGGGRGWGEVISIGPPRSFWALLNHLVQISFSPQPSAAVKIKDGSYNFHWKQILSTCSPKLCLLCKLSLLPLFFFFFNKGCICLEKSKAKLKKSNEKNNVLICLLTSFCSQFFLFQAVIVNRMWSTSVWRITSDLEFSKTCSSFTCPWLFLNILPCIF